MQTSTGELNNYLFRAYYGYIHHEFQLHDVTSGNILVSASAERAE